MAFVMNTTTTMGYADKSSATEGIFEEEKLLIGVGVVAGLVFSLGLIALISAVACRGQHIRVSKTRRRQYNREISTVSMAYSDFESYKAARPFTLMQNQNKNSGSNPNPRRQQQQQQQVRPSASSFSEVQEDYNKLIGGWRYIEPLVHSSGSSNSHTSQTQTTADSTLTNPQSSSASSVALGYGVASTSGVPSNAPDLVLADRKAQINRAYSNKMLSPTYLNRDLREEQKRQARMDSDQSSTTE